MPFGDITVSDAIQLYSFGNYDRSGKIRWLAYELGLEVEEHRVKLGEHRQFPYRDLNPYAAIPSMVWKGKTLFESEAICTFLAEQHPEGKLLVNTNEEARSEFLMWLAICANTLETKLVEYYLSSRGLYPEETRGLYKKDLEFKLRIALEQLSDSKYLVADRLTLADITLAYSLRLAVNAELIEFNQVAHYLKPLAQRGAAIKAGFFESIKTELEG